MFAAAIMRFESVDSYTHTTAVGLKVRATDTFACTLYTFVFILIDSRGRHKCSSIALEASVYLRSLQVSSCHTRHSLPRVASRKKGRAITVSDAHELKTHGIEL